MHDKIQVPKDNADLALLEIDFPTVSLEEIADPSEIEPYLRDYLKREGFEPDSETLGFIRTAKIEEVTYWIWRFSSDGEACYATATQMRDGSTCLGCETDHWNLTPEQFIFGDFHECF